MCPLRRRDLDVLPSTIHCERDPTELVDPDRDDRPASRDGLDDLRNRHRFAGNAHPTRLPDVEPVYGTVIQLARLAWRVQGLKFTITGPLMRGMHHIEVDRGDGSGSFEQACRALKEGELVGVYPEATISRSFEIKAFKSGAARMAIAADVPIVPHIVWGAQRIWTKGHPKNMRRPKVPISIAVGEPIEPTLPPTELTALLHSRMQHLLERVQDA